jgi:hypothetical protein
MSLGVTEREQQPLSFVAFFQTLGTPVYRPCRRERNSDNMRLIGVALTSLRHEQLRYSDVPGLLSGTDLRLTYRDGCGSGHVG